MEKVKIFSDCIPGKLEKEINDWILNNQGCGYEIIDIKYSTSISSYDTQLCVEYLYSAMIIYSV